MEIHFKTRVLTDAAQLLEIKDQWIGLYERCPNATPFQRPEWIVSWVENFFPEDIRLIEVRYGNTLVGLAPLLVYRRAEERVLAFMGGGISDYLDVLVDPLHEAEVMRAIFYAIQQLDGWTTLDFTDLPSHSILHRTTLAQLATPHDQCSSLPLPASRDELLQHFSKRQRANVRQARSRIQKAGGADVELAKPANAAEFLEDLFRLHAMRWLKDGQAGVLDDEKVKTFHRTAAPELIAKDILRLYRLRLSGQTIAVIYTLVDRATAFCYLQGYDPEFAALSPGTYLMFSAMEDAIFSGRDNFDLLRGEEGYKQHWKAQSQPTFRIQLSRAGRSVLATRDPLAA